MIMDKYQNQFFNECQLLGILMKDDSYFNESKLVVEHFYNYNNREIFKKMQELKTLEQPINLINLQQLDSDFLFRAGGVQNLREIHDHVLSVYSFKSIQDVVIQFTTLETAINHAKQFLNVSAESNRITNLRSFMDNLNGLDLQTGIKEKSAQQKLLDRMKQHKIKKEGLSGCHTGFNSLNNATDGFQLKDLIVIGARPSMGKTAFALNCLWNSLESDLNQHATFFSIEMAEEGIIDRMLATKGGINLMKMRNPERFFSARNEKKTGEWDKYDLAVAMFQEFGDRIAIHSDKNISDIRTKIRQQTLRFPDKKHIFYIDHLAHIHITGNFQNRTIELETIINELKQIAKDYNCVVVILCQINRESTKRAEKRPTMADLKDCGAIEQVADVIMMLYRESYDDKESADTTFEVIVDKNRQGATGTLLFDFYKETNRIRDRRSA